MCVCVCARDVCVRVLDIVTDQLLLSVTELSYAFMVCVCVCVCVCV